VSVVAHPHAGPIVGLDVGPVRRDPAGVGIYVSELASALDEVASRRIIHLGARTSLRRQTASASDTTTRRRFHLEWLLRDADAEARAAGCELVHYTNAVAPPRTRVPYVATVHDLSILRLPGSHPLRRLALVPFLLPTVRRSRMVIVPSQATADELRRLLRVPARRIEVIALAARRPAFDAPDGAVPVRLGLEPYRYVVALGTIEPRKNHARLLAAFEQLVARRPELQLVIVGARGWRDAPFRRALHRSAARGRVVLTGRLSDREVAALLASSSLVAYASLYEGFGLPILEAMAAGAPVVTSRVSSMPEVAGGAAVLVDPTSVASIARGMTEAIERRDDLIAAGLARAAERTWGDVARDTMAVYDRALASEQ
jgi:glycosyltransferase involved in cell wall biosynthesis